MCHLLLLLFVTSSGASLEPTCVTHVHSHPTSTPAPSLEHLVTPPPHTHMLVVEHTTRPPCPLKHTHTNTDHARPTRAVHLPRPTGVASRAHHSKRAAQVHLINQPTRLGVAVCWEWLGCVMLAVTYSNAVVCAAATPLWMPLCVPVYLCDNTQHPFLLLVCHPLPPSLLSSL